MVSSTLSMLASKLAAKKIAVGWIALTGFMYMPHNQMTREITHTLLSYMVKPITKPNVTAPLLHIRKATPSTPETPQLTLSQNLYLHSFEKEYTCVFSGKVTCGDGLCQSAEVLVHVNSKQNLDIAKTAIIQPDGSYQVSILLKELVHEHIDWWIVADSPESTTKQVQGRQILMDDSVIAIEEPLRLL